MNKNFTTFSVRICFLVLLSNIYFCPPLYAQKKKVNVDELYETARKAAFDEKDYSKALEYCNKALAVAPEYTDIVLFKGRIFGWTNQQDSARTNFNLAMLQKPKLMDVYVAYANFEYWNNNYELAHKIIETGLQYNQQHPDLLMVKAKVLAAQKNYAQAMDVTELILDNEPAYTEARTLQQQVKDKVSKNSVGLKYDYIKFDKQYPDPWHLITATYTRQTDFGPISLNVNYVNKFRKTGLQYEIEAYPHISKTFYTYINLGYSDNVVTFPNWRAGFSLYANLPKSFEAEAGIRYLYFASSAVFYTLYVGKYYGSFLFSARTYITPTTNIAHSYIASARYYYGNTDQYLGLNVGYGISPDDRSYANLFTTLTKLKSSRAGFELKHAIKRLNIINFNASVIRQEYFEASSVFPTVGHQFQVGIGYARRF